MFYSEKEYETMKYVRQQAVEDVGRRYTLLSFSDHVLYDVSEVFGCCTLTGIENLLTPDISEKSIKCIARCRRAVLKEQARQIDSGDHDPDKLATVSQFRSIWAVERAKKI
eukprot:825889_1